LTSQALFDNSAFFIILSPFFSVNRKFLKKAGRSMGFVLFSPTTPPLFLHPPAVVFGGASLLFSEENRFWKINLIIRICRQPEKFLLY